MPHLPRGDDLRHMVAIGETVTLNDVVNAVGRAPEQGDIVASTCRLYLHPSARQVPVRVAVLPLQRLSVQMVTHRGTHEGVAGAEFVHEVVVDELVPAHQAVRVGEDAVDGVGEFPHHTVIVGPLHHEVGTGDAAGDEVNRPEHLGHRHEQRQEVGGGILRMENAFQHLGLEGRIHGTLNRRIRDYRNIGRGLRACVLLPHREYVVKKSHVSRFVQM